VVSSQGGFYGEGWLSAYDAEPSAATLAYRYELGHVQWGYDAYIAVADCTYVGHSGTMRYVETGKELSVQVFDCSGHDAKPGTAVIESAGFIAELDYASWKHYGLGKVELTIDD
jgi:hypothetical protein